MYNVYILRLKEICAVEMENEGRVKLSRLNLEIA